MKSSQRLSVRLSDREMDRLTQFCDKTGLTMTFAVEKALDVLLADPAEAEPIGTSSKRLAPPAQITSLMTKYRAWGRGDPREELYRLYTELAA